jgi:hypothetical protein
MVVRVAVEQERLAAARQIVLQLVMAVLVSPIALPVRLFITPVVAVVLPMAIQALLQVQ